MIWFKTIVKITALMAIYIAIVSFSFAADNVDSSCRTTVSQLKFSLFKWTEATVKDMIKSFCTNISDVTCVDGDDIGGDYFDANQSIFLSVLCDNVWAGNWFTKIIRKWDESILMKTWFTQFEIFDYGYLDDDYGSEINNCDYRFNVMNWCNLSEHLPNMFDEIINDYFNIKQADLYWVDVLSADFNAEESANKFSAHNFEKLNICNSSTPYYEDSCKYLQNYMKDARNLLKKTKVINVEKLIKADCTKAFKDSLIYRGLLGDDTTSNNSFLNAVYNEYMWYRLFMSYYSYNLSVEPNYSELDSDSSISDKISLNREKILLAQNKTFKTRQAISIALRSLSEISGSFPMHIWFTMYQEDANMFMKELAKIYPPIRTLYDKLRNVQEAE